MNNYFIIASQERCGTHWLRWLLNCHPDVTVTHEIFNTDVYEKLHTGFDDLAQHVNIPWYNRNSPLKYVKNLPWKEEDVHRGITIQPHHFQVDDSGYDSLVESNLKTIILYRRNVFRQYVSMLQAKKRGNWEVREGQAYNVRPKVRIDLVEWQKYLASKMSCIFDTRLDFPFSLKIAYEDLVDISAIPLEIQKFLGIKKVDRVLDRPLKPVRVGNDNLYEIIENKDECQSVIDEWYEVC